MSEASQHLIDLDTQITATFNAADVPLADQVAAVQRAWAEPIPRLLVFDNLDSDDGEALVQQYRPTSGGCRVLITSRRGVWDTALGITALPLRVLPRAFAAGDGRHRR